MEQLYEWPGLFLQQIIAKTILLNSRKYHAPMIHILSILITFANGIHA